MEITVWKFLQGLVDFLKNRILTPRKAFTTGVAGGAALASWVRYFLQLGRQIRQILGKDTKRGIVANLTEVFAMSKSLFAKRNTKFPKDEEKIMTLLKIFPKNIIKSEQAISAVREAASSSGLEITFFTVFATLLIEFSTVYVNFNSLVARREIGAIDDEQYYKEMIEALLSCVFGILSTVLSMTYILRDYTHVLKLVLQVMGINLMSHVLAVVVTDIGYIILRGILYFFNCIKSTFKM